VKNKRTITIVLIITFVICIVIFSLIYYINKDNKYIEFSNDTVYIEKETVEKTIEKFNNLILDNGMKSYISKDNCLIKNNVYYYTIYEDISLYIIPIEYTKNQLEDITYDMGIYYPKNSQYEGNAKLYIKHLIKINNPDLSNEQIEKLIDEVIIQSKKNNSINKNTGITVRYFGNSDSKYKEFVIRRNYQH